MNAQIEVPEEQASARRREAVGDFTGPCRAWCEWLSGVVLGMAATMERIGSDGTSVVQFQNWPLVAIRAHRLENGVNAIGLIFAVNSHERRFEITGVRGIQLERDAAGFPTMAEFVTESERVVLRFAEVARATPISQSNGWGE
jgi:hypothetical protein